MVMRIKKTILAKAVESTNEECKRNILIYDHLVFSCLQNIQLVSIQYQLYQVFLSNNLSYLGSSLNT